MKTKTILFAFVAVTFSFFTTQAFAQVTQNEQELKLEQDSIKDKATGDAKRLKDAADLRSVTKSDAKVAQANAKEANRINNDASQAAKQAKQASRMEVKAQKNRIKADNQAKKAEQAVTKSENN